MLFRIKTEPPWSLPFCDGHVSAAAAVQRAGANRPIPKIEFLKHATGVPVPRHLKSSLHNEQKSANVRSRSLLQRNAPLSATQGSRISLSSENCRRDVQNGIENTEESRRQTGGVARGCASGRRHAAACQGRVSPDRPDHRRPDRRGLCGQPGWALSRRERRGPGGPRQLPAFIRRCTWRRSAVFFATRNSIVAPPTKQLRNQKNKQLRGNTNDHIFLSTPRA